MVGLARLSLASRSLVVMIALVLSGVGIYAIPQLKQQMFPSLNLPMVTVMSSYPGASPEVVEEQVTKPIENSLQGLEDLEEITSTSGETVSSVMASFDFEVEVDDVVADIQEAVNGISGELPEDVEPTVAAGGTDDIPVIVLAAVNGGDEQALLDKLESTAVPELSRIPDVQDVEVTGARANQVVITPDDEKMEEAGLSPTAITDALQANGVTAPAGSLTQDDMKVSVQVGDKLSRVEDVEELYLT
ncbi:MAG: efflux RND transporter permease subunit, partial [Stackebrandtia sp.]